MAAEHEPLADTLRRLKEERDAADRRYNDALTALDRLAVPDPAQIPLPPEYDAHQIAALNQSCDVVVAPPAAGGLKGRLAGFVWNARGARSAGGLQFHAADHVNRNVEAHRQQRRAAMRWSRPRASGGPCQRRSRPALLYLQQITGYVDTKDRTRTAGRRVERGAQRRAGENGEAVGSAASRDQRLDGRLAAQTRTDELRAVIGISQHASLTLKRELERLIARADPGGPTFGSGGPQPATPSAAAPSTAAFAPALDAYKYVAFEDRFRGSRDVIRQRLESYLPYFDGASDVLDVGCGRGEFLELLAGAGISGRGLDLNHEMAEGCRARGLDVAEADVVSYLDGLPDASLGGLFAAQVVEHLEPAYLLRFLELAHHKLRDGAPMVLETLNPACWVAFFESYIRDITHRWPLHPETLQHLVLASGFTRARIEFRSPVPAEDRLQGVAVPSGTAAALEDVAEAFNANVEKLNGRLFTFMDYAIVAENSATRA